VDIRKPLPWSDGVVGFVFAEHVIEHVTAPQAVRFLQECCRVLRPGGVLRLAFPDVERVHCLVPDDVETYAGALRRRDIPATTRGDCVRSVVCCWEHQSAWTHGLALVLLRAVGFHDVTVCDYGMSSFPELRGVERHHLTVGKVARLETSIMEAVR
jgi:SAM-dependent methyltransferase